MADSQQPVDQQVTMADTQQVTSKTPATKQKNPKRVAVGKAIAERTRIAREEQKKAINAAHSIIAQAKEADPVADPPAPVANPPSETTKNVLTITQWQSVISIIVSLVGIYYKREEKPPQDPPPSPVDNARQAPPPSPAPKRKRGIRDMDMCEECVKNAKNIFLMTEMN